MSFKPVKVVVPHSFDVSAVLGYNSLPIDSGYKVMRRIEKGIVRRGVVALSEYRSPNLKRAIAKGTA